MDNNFRISSFSKRRKRVSSQKKRDIAKNFLPEIKIDNIADFVASLSGKAVNLEIGFGSGEHIFDQAKNNLEEFFVGCEVYYNGIVNLATEIHDAELDNIRIFEGDALDFLSEIPDDMISNLYLLFPDPWPKKKHYKRRFVKDINLKLLSRKLKNKANFRLVTDAEDYANWSLGKIVNNPNFHWLNNQKNACYREPEGFVPSKYYTKAKESNSKIYFFDFINEK